MTIASAPGKAILCGEHAVVYGHPAIAIPLTDVRATATVEAAPPASGVVFDTPDVGGRWTLRSAQSPALTSLMQHTLQHLHIDAEPDLLITLSSTIPIASGMGSGAALSAALVKALVAHCGVTFGPAEVSELVYEAERFYHGTPSGIDNSVVSYEQAIWFERERSNVEQRRGPTIEPLQIGAPVWLIIGDTGVHAPTHITVGGVRERWQHDREHYTSLFGAIGQVTTDVRGALAAGDSTALGRLLNYNQELLQAIGVSSSELEQLIDAARAAGALGAKLSGGGGGGIMLAVTDETHQTIVAHALLNAGATRVIQTVVK